MIRVPQVRVVDEDGAQRGVMPTPEALRLAQERGYDLVEVAPMASPPVVRFLDFGQYKYELTKREKEAKRKQRSVTFKEVRLKPKIGTGDFDTKVRRAIEFLEEGDRIKVSVQFRGRELTHPEIGRNLLTRFTDQIKEHGILERAPLLEGKSMHITVASVHKPKSQEGPATPSRHEGGMPGLMPVEPQPAATVAAPAAARPAPVAARPAPAAASAVPGPATGEAPTVAPAAPKVSARPAVATGSAPTGSAPAAPAAKERAVREPATRAAREVPIDGAPAAAPRPAARPAARTTGTRTTEKNRAAPAGRGERASESA
jgi:translation initiation factor IF-3